MRILAFAASNSAQSINKQLVTHASEIFKSEVHTGAEVEILDLNDFEMPIYSIDREKSDGIPEAAQTFFNKIGEADALLISYAEHNGFYTSAYKNIFDWASRIEMKVFQNKPMVIMSASIGPNGGANALKTAVESAPFFGATILGSLSVGPFSEKFDAANGMLSDTDLANSLRQSLSALRETENKAA
ncbi:MAG: NAD(P)H-dependent oxidoreductase [Pseudomonadota bacterium]